MSTPPIIQNGPIHCTWKPNTKEKSPHSHETFDPQPPKICETILDHIGHTPLVRINNITKTAGIKCSLFAKCEFFNAGGSVKDRIGKRMIEDAEKNKVIKPGDTLIEPTSGNTGIGLALAAAIKGYKMIITLPEKMSSEKVDVLKALGASIIRTPTEAAWDSPESHIGVAKRLNQEIPNSHILDQYKNPSNPLAHYDQTAEELLYQMDGKIDYCVVTAGTGGTVTGLARKLKEKIPDVKIVGVDPHGSILATPNDLNSRGIFSYKVEGIGYDFIPTVLEQSIVDLWIKTEDKDAFVMARRLIREEGLLCGGSSGTAMWAAIKLCQDLPADKRVVVILADSVRNYMSKFLSDDWMIEAQFLDRNAEDEFDKLGWSKKVIADLNLPVPFTVNASCVVEDAIKIMKSQGFDQIPVVDSNSNVLGVITEGNLMSQILHKRAKITDSCSSSHILYKKFKEVSSSTTLSELSRIFDKEPFALVVASQKCFSAEGTVDEKRLVTGVATRIDLLNFISKQTIEK
eukprot:TRINITY_DN2622_c0_g1_i2.p1 TRINITY_DN2622_c0_g1~~TRINITY_DN2622_c0_g1_i2.p1  ORF type:complete len:516 (-),score=102.97 TRINITY_DN2622_c0_g1_i2:124-1671(-)